MDSEKEHPEEGDCDDNVHLLVTGATSGLGEAIAAQLAERGARVLVGARTTERGQVAADRIRSRAPNADLVRPRTSP